MARGARNVSRSYVADCHRVAFPEIPFPKPQMQASYHLSVL